MKDNYVVTVHKPSRITHSCVGNFTDGNEINLITAKTDRIEIFTLTNQVLKPTLEVQIYGRITALELFLLRGEAQNLLFIATRHKYSVLQWNPEAGELITRSTGEVPDRICNEEVNPFGRIDRVWELIGLHMFNGYLEVIPLNVNGQLGKAFHTRLLRDNVVDFKFLYGYLKPTIAVLYKNGDDYHVQTHEVNSHDENPPAGIWSVRNPCDKPTLLLPVPAPLYGVLVFGKKSIAYCDASGYRRLSNELATIKSYGAVDCEELVYVVADKKGFLHKLKIVHENEKFTELKLEVLVQTPTRAASTISYLGKQLVFIGSTYGDSQLIKLNFQPHAEGSHAEALESYVNIGPIQDFCVSERQGTIVTRSGHKKEAYLRIMRYTFEINRMASVEEKGITGMWSLRSSSTPCDKFDKFLVVSYLGWTQILSMNINNKSVDTTIEGVSTQVGTLFCHNAVHGQLIQVTSNYVRLVSLTSGKLQAEYSSGFVIRSSTANLTKVLLAGEDQLVCLRIGEGELKEIKRTKLDYEVTCLDMNRIGENQNNRELAAIGMRGDKSIGILSLPGLELLTKEYLVEDNTVARSVLICAIEGAPYLLCGLGDGNVLIFSLNLSTGQLTDRKKVSLGSKPTLVFATSERPTVIYSYNKIMLFSKLDLKEVITMCPFNSEAFPDSIAVANSDEFTVGHISSRMNQIRSIPLRELPYSICHQDYSRTFALCTEIRESRGSIQLLDDQSVELKSSYSLEKLEVGMSIISCSFLDDSSVYYIVGTGYISEEDDEDEENDEDDEDEENDEDEEDDDEDDEDNKYKGRILVFEVVNGNLELVAQKEMDNFVRVLAAFNGKLLTCLTNGIQLHTWMRNDDGTFELQFECWISNFYNFCSPKTRGNLIVVGSSLNWLINKLETGAIEKSSYNSSSMNRSVAVEILDDGVCLLADHLLNLCTIEKDATLGECRVVGRFHLGYRVAKFMQCSGLQMPDFTGHQIPTFIFGTHEGAIGVVVSLPHEDFCFSHDLQSKLRELVKGVGDFSHVQFRSSFPTEMVIGDSQEFKDSEFETFVDGDLIESFLDLPSNKMEEVAEAMALSVEELIKRVQDLKMLH